MLQASEVLIRVHGSWSGWRSVEIPLEDLEDVHWRQPPGAPHPLVHGFVWCTHDKREDVRHECVGASAPRRVLVCILKHHTVATIYADLARRAGKRCVSNAFPDATPGPHPEVEAIATESIGE
jgi:hypothetical protein